MKLAVLTPLAPVRSGISSYSAILLAALARQASVTAVVDQDEWVAPEGCEVVRLDEYRSRRSEFDAVVAQMGNNPWHEFIYREALESDLVVVLHDVVLHHLIVEMTLARGDGDSYVETLRRNHGEAGAAYARGRAGGFHTELGNFLFPSSIEIANRSRSVIVHNRWAARRLLEDGARVPIHIVPHPMAFDEAVELESPLATRSRAGFALDDVIIGMFGFVTAAKRPEIVFEAFARASVEDPRLRLLVVGEPAPNVDLSALAGQFGIPPDRWQATGYVEDSDFEERLRAVDRVVNLRYPSAGETSGALIRILATGKPVAVNDYAQFAELPDEVVTKIPFGGGEIDSLARFMRASDSVDGAGVRSQWIRGYADPDRVAALYLAAIRGDGESARAPELVDAMPLFPCVAVDRIECRRDGQTMRVDLTVRNGGPSRVRASTFGEPEYRMIARIRGTGTAIVDRWIALSGDLDPGDRGTIEITFPAADGQTVIELTHALEGIPVADPTPFFRQEIVCEPA